MNIENLKKDMVINNYRRLCELLGVKIEYGNSKVAQLKELSRFVKFSKNKNKIIINDIYDTPIEKDNYFTGNRRVYKNFNIDRDNENSTGVYIIQRDNDIYIGSTMRKNGFRGRFLQHNSNTDGGHHKTYSLLKNGGKFSILWCAEDNGVVDEVLIRMIEEEYIKYYKRYTDYNVINTRESTFSYTDKYAPKKDFTNVKIDTDDIEMVINFLKYNYIDFKLK